MWATVQAWAAKLFFSVCSTVIAPQVKLEYEEKLLQSENEKNKLIEELNATKQALVNSEAYNSELHKQVTGLLEKVTSVVDGDAALDAITKKGTSK